MQKINWFQILATVSITTLITIATGMLLFKWQQPKKLLEYELTSSTKFSNDELNTQIHKLLVSNKGSVVANELVLNLKLDEGKIRDYKILLNEGIQYSENYDTTSLILNLQNLNPDERLSLSFLTEGKKELIPPVISLRANGINGIKKNSISNNEQSEKSDFLFSLLMIPIALSTTFLLLLRKGFSFFGISFGQDLIVKRDDSQNEILSYYCSINNLEDEVERYLSLPKSNLVYYWTEADRLTMKALNLDDDYRRKIISVLSLIYESRDSISIRSKGILLFDIAKLYKKVGDENKFKEYIELAKSKTPKLVDERIKIDPYFKENDSKQSI